MPQPIMKKYKHGEFGADYGKASNEKLDNLIYEFNSGGIKVSNWIELKNFTNLIISSYAG